jgi:hypothetical protein
LWTPVCGRREIGGRCERSLASAAGRRLHRLGDVPGAIFEPREFLQKVRDDAA